MEQIEQNHTEIFFHNLSNKFYKENDLSDITWALCSALPEFKKLFLKFFFTDEFQNSALQDISNIFLHREYTRSSSRPDFYFEYKNDEYIIEVKKGDINDHFEQYKADFPKAKFGWIANYSMSEQEGIEIRQWEKFKKFLEEEIKDSSAKDLIQSYIAYLKNVCAIIKIQKMKLDSSPLFLMKVIRNIIEEQRKEFSTAIYRNQKDGSNFVACDYHITELRFGEYFSIAKRKNPVHTIYPWFGMYMQESGATIWLEFVSYEGWCKPVYDIFASQKNNSDGEYFLQPELYDDFGQAVGFQLKEEWLSKINNAETLQGQEEILRKYFEEVIQYVQQYI